MSQQPENDLQAELAALRQRLSNLEAEHRELKRQTVRARRPAFSRKFLFSAFPVVLLLAAVGVLYATDALEIDSQGLVKIAKKLVASEADVNGVLTAQTLNVVTGGSVNGKLTAQTLTTTGNVDIGTQSLQAKLNVNNEATFQKKVTVAGGLSVTGDFKEANGVEFRHTNSSQGIGFGYNTIYATGSNGDQNLYLKARGKGVVGVNGTLLVNESATINGKTTLSDTTVAGNLLIATTEMTANDATGVVAKKGLPVGTILIFKGKGEEKVHFLVKINDRDAWRDGSIDLQGTTYGF